MEPGALLGRVKSIPAAGETEEVGFEPTDGQDPSPVFKTGPFNHSGTPPNWKRCMTK